MITDTRGRWSVKAKLGNLFGSSRSAEKTKRDLLEKIHRADLIMQEEKCPRFHTVIIPRLVAIRDRDYQKLMNTHDSSEKDKLIGSVSAIDEFFRELRNDKEAGIKASTELDLIKKQETK